MTKTHEDLLNNFMQQFEIKAVSLASQNVYIDTPIEATGYEDTVVFGDTLDLEFYYKDNHVLSIPQPRSDYDEILRIAKLWDEAGSPIPGEDNDFFHRLNEVSI